MKAGRWIALAAVAVSLAQPNSAIADAHGADTLPVIRVSDARRVTSGPHEHLLANYFGINAWSPDFRKLVALETDLNGRLPEVEDACSIGLVDVAAGTFEPFAKTVCWNFQEAAMAHWLPSGEVLYNDLRGGALDWDGHCTYSPDGKWLSSEGYRDEHNNRHWKMLRLADGAVFDVGSFFVPEAYRPSYWRCDLHARWRADGRQLAFNSTHEGSRQVYVRDVEIKRIK